MDLSYGIIYCFLCRDYMYDSDFENTAKKMKYKSAKHLGLAKTQFPPWEPTAHELEMLRKNPQRKRISENSYIGKTDML